MVGDGTLTSHHANIEILLMLLLPCLNLKLTLFFGILEFDVSIGVVCSEEFIVTGWHSPEVGESD